jgi:ubiquinone/menaquinone biosynthesis C-methylase UbiE
VPRSLAAWARRRGHALRVLGIDRHGATVEEARHWLAREGGRPALARADGLRLPLADGAVDYAVASCLLHHLDDADAARCIAEMARVARRGIVVQDLLRSRRALAWVWCLTRLLRNPVTRFDGPASVRQAFRPAEARALARAAGAPWLEFRRRLGHRFTLAGHRGAGG